MLLLGLVGCRPAPSQCPQAKLADPEEIPSGSSETKLFVELHNPSPDNGLEVTTEITAESGTVEDPFARETTYSCAHDVSGPVQLCVKATYSEGESESVSEGNLTQADSSFTAQSEEPGVGASSQYLRAPTVYLIEPLDCSEKQCTTIECPEQKNVCPVVSSLTVEPAVVLDGGTATINVDAEDPDDNPQALVTTLTASHGSIADPHARQTTYTCDPMVGGVIEICVVASDGESSCDAEVCTTVRCPGEPLGNTCPIVEDFTADPNPIAPGNDTTTVRVDAIDPDDFPDPLQTTLSSKGEGAFEDRSASETTFRCGGPGPVEICVVASDGDPACDTEPRCITVQCPSDVRLNLCPQLFVINGVPREIPLGETSTRIETRGQDTDGLPLPLVLTLNSLWGSFENTVNIQEPNNVIAQNATYVCSQPGEVEICVDATDGACVKTLCDVVVCPADIPTP